jgi:hypothetical protein
MRRARLHAERCCAAARRCGGDGRGGRCRHRRAVMDGRAPPTRQPERGWASPAASGRGRGRGRRGCPDAGHAIGRLSASAVRRADVCPLGRADVRCPRDRCPTRPARSRCPDGHASGHRGPASALSAPRWILACVGAAGPPTSGRVGCDMSRWSASGWSSLPELGPGGEGMVVGSAVPGSDRVDGRPAAGMDPRRLRRRARRRADMGAVQRRVPVGWWGHEQEQLLTRRRAGASWTSCRCDGRLGREMLITLRGRCAGVVRLRRAHSVR